MTIKQKIIAAIMIILIAIGVITPVIWCVTSVNQPDKSEKEDLYKIKNRYVVIIEGHEYIHIYNVGLTHNENCRCKKNNKAPYEQRN